MIFAGLDLSATGTGVCVLGPKLLKTFRTGVEIDYGNPTLRIERELVERNIEISRKVVQFLRPFGVSAIAVEKYSAFAGKGKKKNQTSSSLPVLAEVGGVVKARLWLDLTLVAEPMAPSSIRKLALGNGRFSKKESREALKEKGLEFRSHDEADAFNVAAALMIKTREIDFATFWEERIWVD